MPCFRTHLSDDVHARNEGLQLDTQQEKRVGSLGIRSNGPESRTLLRISLLRFPSFVFSLVAVLLV